MPLGKGVPSLYNVLSCPYIFCLMRFVPQASGDSDVFTWFIVPTGSVDQIHAFFQNKQCQHGIRPPASLRFLHRIAFVQTMSKLGCLSSSNDKKVLYLFNIPFVYKRKYDSNLETVALLENVYKRNLIGYSPPDMI